ncbi:YkgJ family cysteine cluster protein [Lonepinella sp. MS14437]|uniref:YkgJ family cysteine cluster protein n=1 Tax=unclassified Lonepinella TaxID=2642006 RepID=UPI0036DC7AD8
MENAFPCYQCGKCCCHIGGIDELKTFDLGNGICRHYEPITHLCQIYQERPLVCRVEAYYKQNLSHILQWQEYVEMNLKVCDSLNQ